ncbi:signal peptidase II [Anaerotardibacter muris]|uniref:signal peptidase II n=1 Tax=Anaerotardibacter muris TaxID=2941505 RepID=UPI00203D9C9D|nr:signal peptidase II [Anaerotardibacter muris]
MSHDKDEPKTRRALRNRIAFCVIVVLWVFFDRVTKIWFEGRPAGASAIDVGGIVELKLAHNFGAAWSSFSGMTMGLIVVTFILCIVIVTYALMVSKAASMLEMVGLALVFAGGVGNLIDRMVNGYVIDFISPLFIDFPTFNIADTGITCGIVCVIIALGRRYLSASKQAKTNEEA